MLSNNEKVRFPENLYPSMKKVPNRTAVELNKMECVAIGPAQQWSKVPFTGRL